MRAARPTPRARPPPRRAAVIAAAAAPPPRGGPGVVSLSERLAEDVLAVQAPAKYNIRFSDALERLTESALEAYCCGWTEDDARREITRASARVDGAPRVDASAALVALVWLTAEAAKDVTRAADVAVRWSKAPAVSPATTATWSGFVSLIVGAALGERRWAWYPLDRLATELALASDAPPPPPADVAELARVVYATLDAVTASSAAQKKRGRRRGEEGGSWAR